MTNIIAGRLQTQSQVQEVIGRLVDAGFSQTDISSFYVSPPGRHDVQPDADHHDNAVGTREVGGTSGGAVRGASTGGVVGVAVGVAAAPLTGPLSPALGALVGAHLGSLVGAVSKMKDKGESEAGNQHPDHVRQAGMVVAVGIADTGSEKTAIALLRDAGADQIERAQGTIREGDWQDFNPTDPPALLSIADMDAVA